MQEWGLDLAKEASINSATVKYTEFLLAAASGKVEGVKGPGKLATPFERTKVAAYTLAAMSPCMRLYAFLGKEFQVLLDVNEGNHPYKKWIDNYSSESFQVCLYLNSNVIFDLMVNLIIVCLVLEDMNYLDGTISSFQLLYSLSSGISSAE